MGGRGCSKCLPSPVGVFISPMAFGEGPFQGAGEGGGGGVSQQATEYPARPSPDIANPHISHGGDVSTALS